jgi:glycoprotein endo-alpha-1,2-mannosidase
VKVSFTAALLAAAIGSVFAGQAQASTSRLSVPVTADAYVSQPQPTTNFGSAARLSVRKLQQKVAYLRFQVPVLGVTVDRVVLRLRATSTSAPGFDVRTATDNGWNEGTITYSTAPPVGPVVASSGPFRTARTISIDVTSLVSPGASLNLALTMSRGTELSVASREYGDPAAPRLDIETRPDSLTVAAYYYSWYGTSRRHWQDGYLRHLLSVPQAPQLGEYDSRSSSAIASHFQWAQQYGIDAFISSWWGQNSYEDVTTRDYLIKSPSIGTTKIAILYESIHQLGLTNGLINFDSTTEQKLISDFDYLARTYFSDPHYERIDGKPVVYLYVTRIYRGNYAQALANLRSTIRSRYGYDMYLVGDEVDWDGSPNAGRIALFDAITAYTMYSDLQPAGWPDDTGFLSGVQQRYNNFKSVADAAGVAFIPNTQPGFNDRGVRLSANHYALPREVNSTYSDAYSLFGRFLQLASGYVDPQARVMTITSWNEWHEDSQIEPTAPAAPSAVPTTYTQGYNYFSYGFKPLDILKTFKGL